MILQEYLKNNSYQALLVTNLTNIRYFTGFSGSNATLLILEDRVVIFTDFRYQEQIRSELKIEAEIQISGDETLTEFMKKHLNTMDKIAVEAEYVTARQMEKYRQILPRVSWSLVDLDNFRIIKSKQEIECIKKAAMIADQAFTRLTKNLQVGMSEIEVAALLEYYMRTLGSEKLAFETIVASGENSSKPHAKPGVRNLSTGDFVTIDFGAVCQGYHSDITRTVVMGKASNRQREIYQIVLTAQLKALDKVKTGITAAEVDFAAREEIIQAGYGQFFGHSTGHGVGLQIHEEPRIAAGNINVVLQENMVITVEPGIYLPGFGGVRIEDLIVVTKNGKDILTATEKQLLEIY